MDNKCESTHCTSAENGKLVDPRGRPFEIVFSKEHPEEQRAHGFDDDLLLPLALKLDCVCYKYMFSNAQIYGVSEPMPSVPLFSDCEVLFREMGDTTSPNYEKYRAFANWWTNVLARCILSGAVDSCVHFNLAGYSKQRVEVVTERYQAALTDQNNQQLVHLTYPFLKHRNPYVIVPHVLYNVPWTDEEKQRISTPDKYPGFTDWDLSLILNDQFVLEKTRFYNVANVAQLEAMDSLSQLSSEELASTWGIVRPNVKK